MPAYTGWRSYALFSMLVSLSSEQSPPEWVLLEIFYGTTDSLDIQAEIYLCMFCVRPYPAMKKVQSKHLTIDSHSKHEPWSIE